MKKKRTNLIGKKIMAVMLCAFVLSTSIHPNFATYVYANSMEIQGVFNETLAEDKASATIDLRIDEVENKIIESITLPDQSIVVKENFKRDDSNRLLFEYTTTENKVLEYVVEYIENKVEASSSTEQTSPQEATPEVKKEILTYEVKGIVDTIESTLIIDAKDITFKVGEDVDFRKDVTIKDENDKDITDQLNFDIVNYDGYIANKIGTYHVEYNVTHPISTENFSFSRNVTVDEDDKISLGSSDAGAINKGTIEFSSSNATFTSPENFDLSDKSQEVFNLSVHYAPANADRGRKLVIDIPENFSITKVPALSDFYGIDSITVKGNSITLTIPDSLVVEIAFDITLTRQSNDIYKLASKADFNADFIMNGYKNGDENVYTSEVQISLPKFTNEGYTFNSKLEVTEDEIEDYNYSSRRKVSFTLTINREKYTKYDSSFKIKIPTEFNEYNVRFLSDLSTLKIGDKTYRVIHSGSADGYAELYFPNNGYEIEYAYSDDPIEITLVFTFNDSIYSNGFFETTKKLVLSSDFGEQEFGKFTVDTLQEVSVKPQITSDASLYVAGMGTTTSLSFGRTDVSAKPDRYIYKDLTFSYEIPFELEIDPAATIARYDRGAKFSFYTNTGRELGYDSTGKIIVDLEDGEWISKVVFTRYNETSTTPSAPDLRLKIRDKDVDGNPYIEARDIVVKTTIESTDPNVVAVSRDTTLNIVPRNIDAIRVYQRHNSSINKKTTEFTTAKVDLFSVSIAGELPRTDSMLMYDNLKLQIEDKELLALVSGIKFNSRSGNGNVNNKIKIFYTTDKNSELQSREVAASTSASSEFLFELEKGDFLASLYLVYEKFDPYNSNLEDGSDKNDAVTLFSSSLPKNSPLTGVDLNDIYYDTKVTVTADNSTETRVLEGTTPTFKWKNYSPSIKVDDLQSNKVNMNSGLTYFNVYNYTESPSWTLGRVSFSGQGNANAFEYENLDIEITADEELMAFTTGIAISKNTDDREIFQVTFYTNQGNEFTQQVWVYGRITDVDISSKLAVDEYVTKTILHADKFKTTDSKGDAIHGNISLIGKATTKSKISGDFIGLEYKNYPIKAIVSADNLEQNEETAGRSSSISGEVEINLLDTPSITTSYGEQLYQGNAFNVKLTPSMIAQLKGSRGSPYTTLYDEGYELVDPIFYLEVDSNYKYVAGSIKEVDGFEPTVTYLNEKTTDGHSVIKIDMTGFRKIIKSAYKPVIEFQMMVNPSANPAKNLTPIFGLWTDFTNTKVDPQEGIKAKLNILNEVEDSKNIQDGTSNKLVYTDFQSKVPLNEILPINEMGISNLAGLDGSLGNQVIGHDNDLYSQHLSIISNHQSPTKDWIVYVPVPKKGKTVTYQESVDGAVVTKQSEPAKYSMNLAEKVSIPGLPADATVEYSVDENPTYVLDGTTVGNYSANIEASQLHEVTMIKITLPELAAREKLYPVIKYQVASNKHEVGVQRVDGGVYFNMKIGTNTDYQYGENGAYSKLVQYDLEDFNVIGQVWEDRDEPSNSVFDNTDSGKSDVEIIATDKDGNEFTTKTIKGGSYNLAVPSHGETEIKVILPNELTASPKKEYMFVESGKGTSTTSSVVDRDTGKTTVNLVHKDIHNINVGLTTERALAVTPNDLVIVKGTTMPVPAVAFPSYSIISYQNTADTSIATVSARGVLTGIELGTTTATISIPDGQGGSGVVTATYNIKVVPANNPSAVFEHITIFQGGVVDAMKDITIVDGDGKPIDVNDKSKVTINTDSVDISEPGRYPITYTIHDGYNEVTATRYVYVHGNIQLVVPSDITKKVGDIVVALDGASATYIHINEDGTQTETTVTVTTPNEEITSDVVGKVDVPLEARITVEGAEDTASGNYIVTFNEKAKIEVTNDNVTIKVGATFDEIKNMINGNASMTTPDGTTDLTPNINWEILEDFDTSQPGNTITGKITVIDPDTGELIEKEITVTISGNVEIKVPASTDLVEGDIYDPYANVEIIDGDGNVVTLTPEMIISNTVPANTEGNRGVYEVEYQYTDKYGNTKREKTTVNIHGQLQFEDTRRDFLQNDSVENVNSLVDNQDLAYYIDATGDRKLAAIKAIVEASSSIIGKSSQNLEYTHPVNGNDVAFNRAIYVHGHIVIQVPTTYTVKINTDIITLKDVTASYKFVEDDGTIVDKTTTVNSALGNNTTSAVPVEKTIPVDAHVEVVTGLNSNATNSYTVIFNGMPIITTVNDSIEVRVGATFEEIKNIINASASVQYGDEINPTDLTTQINWDEVMAIDTSAKDKTYSVKIYITDKDGATVEKTVEIKISNEIIMNLPSVDKTVGDNFDPKEDVTIFDGQGNPVDMKDVIMDDSKVDMSKPGNYEVTYTYTDSLGNTETKTNTIRVHGKMQFEGVDRIDLIEKDVSYVVDSTKAFYIDNDGKKVYVQGVYDKAVLDQSVVGKNELIYSAVHPINNVKESSEKLNVFIHGDIVFQKPIDIPTGKVNTTLKPNTGVSATFDFVNDDGTITTKDVPVTSKDVTSNTVGYIDGKIDAKVEVVAGLVNTKEDTAKVGFNGLPYIEAANTIAYNGVVPSKADIINKMLASAGMKQANGVVIDLTQNIDYSDVDRIVLDKNGNYQITLTVTDIDGFTTYAVVNVIVNIPTIKPEEPNIPVQPVNPTIPVVPNIPANPQLPVRPNIPTPPLNPIEKDTAAVVSRDIPLSEAEKNTITDDFIKSYITASTEKNGIIDFEILSHNVLPKVGEYEVSIRLEDGRVVSVKIKVVDDGTTDVDQPDYGHDKDCIIHWIILLLFAGYSIYSIAAMLKRRKDTDDLEKALEEMGANELNGEGVEQNEN